MKHLIILFCVCCAFNTYAQSRKFKMGIALTPCYSHRILTNSGLAPASIGKGEQGSVAYQGHIFTHYGFNSKLSLQVGLGYARTGYNNKKSALVFATPEPTAPEYIKFGTVSHDIIVPLLLRYYRTPLKKKFYFTWGLIPNINIVRYSTSTVWYKDGRIEVSKSKDSNVAYLPVNISGAIGFGYNFVVHKKIHGFVQPIFDYNLFGVTKSTPINRRTYTIGVSMGVVLH